MERIKDDSRQMSPPFIRLAHVPGAQGDNVLTGRHGVKKLTQEQAPAILVSYVYVDEFLKKKSRYVYRDWMLDSGAYSAWNSGKQIDLSEYIDFCKKLKKSDQTLSEIIALDVIGSDRGSLANAHAMKAAGVEAMPVFHIGDDWGILREYAAGWDKVGLSCRFGESIIESLRFYDQCFAKVWPKKFHSFGWVAEDMLLRYPFHSCDASSWEVGPCAFGNWKRFGKMSVRGSKQDLRGEVLWYLELEARCRSKWKPLFDSLNWTGNDVRLALVNNTRVTRTFERS
jgi:hypothetical protein